MREGAPVEVRSLALPMEDLEAVTFVEDETSSLGSAGVYVVSERPKPAIIEYDLELKVVARRVELGALGFKETQAEGLAHCPPEICLVM